MKRERCNHDFYNTEDFFKSIEMRAFLLQVYSEQAAAEADERYLGQSQLSSYRKGSLYRTHEDRQNRAYTLPEIVSLIEMVALGTLSREEALLCTDANYIGEIVRNAAHLQQLNVPTAPERLLLWSDQVRHLRVFANGVTPKDAQLGKKLGAAGLGLVSCANLLLTNDVRELFAARIVNREEQIPQSLQQRLLGIQQEQWRSLLHELDGAPMTVSLRSPADSMIEPYPLNGIQDLQLEALFRAILRCEQQGEDYTLDLLIPNPVSGEQLAACIEFIDRVAEQTLCHMYRQVKYRVGVLVTERISQEIAVLMARFTNLLVLEWQENSGDPNTDTVINIGSSGCVLEVETLRSVRRMKPYIDIRTVGALTAVDLPDVYRLGINEVSCNLTELSSVRLSAAQWELTESVTDLQSHHGSIGI
ncbi:hypothetical protein [Paenibacillus sp. IHBB 10380]|uniref:hypothetical protein n=1 Tax=Paenibacillus sp. IHBB 10380 TaxID=1566358 RepID=UPI0005CFBBEB|nr:hypothetical protein [Paenibacillus sp. IHBB 10380]AJS60164.1 hypothetical protein UB51_18740 [Paenibacillus sp. IHBB 10380]